MAAGRALRIPPSAEKHDGHDHQEARPILILGGGFADMFTAKELQRCLEEPRSS